MGLLGGALEAGGDVLAAVVDEQAEVDGDVEVDAQDVGLERRAQAHGCIQVRQPLEQRAARLLRRRHRPQVDQPAQHVRARPKLQRVNRAATGPSSSTLASTAAAPSSSSPARRRRARQLAAAVVGQGEEEQVQGKQRGDHRRFRRHSLPTELLCVYYRVY
uniref:Uncharacterized protein n=1 Tax=Triticum urartu TaxID=4572 RepID=A0A8R7QM40_TRIUA